MLALRRGLHLEVVKNLVFNSGHEVNLVIMRVTRGIFEFYLQYYLRFLLFIERKGYMNLEHSV